MAEESGRAEEQQQDDEDEAQEKRRLGAERGGNDGIDEAQDEPSQDGRGRVEGRMQQRGEDKEREEGSVDTLLGAAVDRAMHERTDRYEDEHGEPERRNVRHPPLEVEVVDDEGDQHVDRPVGEVDE